MLLLVKNFIVVKLCRVAVVSVEQIKEIRIWSQYVIKFKFTFGLIWTRSTKKKKKKAFEASRISDLKQ